MTTGAPPPDTSTMAAVHNVFRSSLMAAPALVASTRGDDHRRALVSNYYANVLSFLEGHHHGEELLLFPLLRDRLPEHKNLLDRMANQHDAVVGPTQEARRRLTTWTDGSDADAVAAADAFAALGLALQEHLDEEETEVIPLCTAHLSTEEWGALPEHGMKTFGGDKIWLIIGLIQENLTPAQIDDMLAHMPPPARDMWDTMGEASFHALMADVRKAG